MKKEKIRLGDRTADNDIKYSGFLSYRHLRIIAWVCLILAQVSVILSIEENLWADTKPFIDGFKNVVGFFANLPIPLFLLANFSNILQKKENFKKMLLFYGGVALGLYVLSNFLVFHYGYQTIHSFDQQYTLKQTADLFGILLMGVGKTGYTLNMFIDLFLCSLAVFFLNYNPNSKLFEGKRIYIFRSLIALPIAYEIACIFIKYFMYFGSLTIPSYVFFLLTSKSPFVFLAFLIIVVCLKAGELQHKKKEGNNEETYTNYTKTNAHSLKTSIMISIVFAAVALLDLVVSTIVMAVDIVNATRGMTDPAEIEVTTKLIMTAWTNIGLTGSICLFIVIPLVMLFSYSKTHKNPIVDTIIPIAGVALIVIVYLEGLFEVVTCNMPIFLEKLKEFVTSLFGGNKNG